MSYSGPVISIKNLSKNYKIYDSPVDRLKQLIFSKIGKILNISNKQYYKNFMALKEVSFDVNKGETLGIIGVNGSGKSTLLQIISGTLTPTAGKVEIIGRIAALLELGSGFNPEFTGIENIFLNASLMGLTDKEIKVRLPDIVKFSGIGNFIHQPVKTYSSGMFVRLAFSVMIYSDPEILIIDEALAVGDATFQAKCMIALRDLIKSKVTILFVSHDMTSVRNLCNKVVWLEDGKMRAFGDSEEITSKYISETHLAINIELNNKKSTSKDNLKSLKIPKDILNNDDLFDTFRRYGNGKARISNIKLQNKNGQIVDTLSFKEKFTLTFFVKAIHDVTHPAFGFSFRDLKGNQLIGSLSSNYSAFKCPKLKRGKKYLIKINGINYLSQGIYTINLGVENIIDLNTIHEFVDVVEHALTFKSTFGSNPQEIFPAMVWHDMNFSVKNFS